MGLMKISTHHKMHGDEVHFVKGTSPKIDAAVWDRIYVTKLKTLPCPEQFQEILPYYLIKYNGKEEHFLQDVIQLPLIDDSDIIIEDDE